MDFEISTAALVCMPGFAAKGDIGKYLNGIRVNLECFGNSICYT